MSTTGSASSRIGDGDIVVTGPTDAWTTWTCGPCSGGQSHGNLLQHWNGRKWSQLALPAQLRYPAVMAGMQASSAQNLWVFTDNARAVVFNGSRWTVKALPSWVVRPIAGDEASVASAVFSPANVWAFSIDAASSPELAAHYSGGSWHKVSLPLIPGASAGLAPDDIWLYGSAKSTGSRLLAHWNGKSWGTIAFPHAANGATLIPYSLVALGPKSVWLVGEIFSKSGRVSSELLHWTGRWSTVSVPASVGLPSQLASDGAAGLWLISTRTEAHATEKTQFVHYAGGHWDALPIPAQGKLASEPGVLASVPASRQMWSIGFLVNGSDPEYGEILGYGD